MTSWSKCIIKQLMRKRYIIIVDKDNRTCSICGDAVQAALVLGIHRNTVKNRLKESYWSDDKYILAYANYLKSNKGGSYHNNNFF